ncbi:TPA: hypothetical protein ACIR5X_000804 [Serratia marcescens]
MKNPAGARSIYRAAAPATIQFYQITGLFAYARVFYDKKNKTPPERGLSIVRRRRQRLSFSRLPAYLRTRESFMIKK